MHPDEQCLTRVDLCLHNASVAEELKCGQLARMWKTVAGMLQGSGLQELPPTAPSKPDNPFQYVIFPTIKSLLIERANAGDVQTCVTLCEVLQVIEYGGKTRIPGLGINLVREWFLSYIELLHQMCLFSAAAFLIKNCKDEVIGAMNQQSTTIHESCPRCGKPLHHTTDSSDGSNGTNELSSVPGKFARTAGVELRCVFYAINLYRECSSGAQAADMADTWSMLCSGLVEAQVEKLRERYARQVVAIDAISCRW
eukprot:CAMPEP_0178826766 /NCGR_PEP_ID=MMETSP0746-20121128/6917_1 /TAXON_ID=913974 /ORGANISM="Nitzschia punctata, Strain CCMP561" /LENGTH=253 /DNA_ID=CAMNT_0020488593 /DNA_START=185 /DNA_END=947 /DNA_ORIENTATION=-